MYFYYLEGTIALLDANLAVIDCGGVGYGCATTRYTLSQLKTGQRHRLYTYCNIREDAFEIYGFSTRDELRCFEMLLGVTGVGPKAALAILSATTPDGFRLAVLTGDEKTLTAAAGVGKKLAQRILLELRVLLLFSFKLIQSALGLRFQINVEIDVAAASLDTICSKFLDCN